MKEIFHHDASVQKLRKLTLGNEVLRERVTELFIASLGTGVRRGMTPIIAYYSARNLPDHQWERFDFEAYGRRYEPESTIPCAICGISHSESRSREEQIADFSYAGRCSMEPCNSHLIDLEDVDNISLEYRAEHVDVLRKLLGVVESVPASVSTTDLQKQLSAAKVMPKSNQAARIWCLRILAELGVITNASVPEYSAAFSFYSFLRRIELEAEAFANMSHRADPVWPLSAGRGQPAVNWPLAYRLFPQLNA